MSITANTGQYAVRICLKIPASIFQFVDELEEILRNCTLTRLPDMNKIIQAPNLALFLLTLLPVSFVLGKIGDPRPLTVGHVRYESHRHTVWATDVRTKKVLWKTGIPMSYYRGEVDPRLERDVQWNIITSFKLKGKILLVTNSKGETFQLDSVTGKLLKKVIEEGNK